MAKRGGSRFPKFKSYKRILRLLMLVLFLFISPHSTKDLRRVIHHITIVSIETIMAKGNVGDMQMHKQKGLPCSTQQMQQAMKCGQGREEKGSTTRFVVFKRLKNNYNKKPSLCRII